MTPQKHIDGTRLRAELLSPVGAYSWIDAVRSTGSTNADLHQAAVDGGHDRTVLIAGEQTAGLGRRGRAWSSPADTGVYCSVLLRPAEVPAAALGSLALVAGLAMLDVADGLGAAAELKWPNDVLAGDDGGKCAGILAEAVPSDNRAVVVGIGINVSPASAVSPGPGGLPAVSLVEMGAGTADRTEICLALLAAFDRRERAWRGAAGDLAVAGLRDDYRARCATLGREVRVTFTHDDTLVGRAVDLDPAGALVVETPDGGRRTVFAGDVVHLRSSGG